MEEIIQKVIDDRGKLESSLSVMKKRRRELNKVIRETEKIAKDIDKQILIYGAEVKLKPVNLQNAKRLNIEKVVSEYFGYALGELLERGRKQELVYARYIYFYLACKYTTIPVARLGGKYFDHASVIHGRDKVQADVDFFEHRGKDPHETVKNIKRIESLLV